MIGVSFGGAIAAAFAHTFPHRVRRVAMLAPASSGVFDPIPVPLLVQFASLPVFGELLSPFFAAGMPARVRLRHPYLIRACAAQLEAHAREQYDASAPGAEKDWKLMQQQLNGHPGFVRSLFSTTRHAASLNGGSEVREWWNSLADNSELEIFVGWGVNDTICPYPGEVLVF